MMSDMNFQRFQHFRSVDVLLTSSELATIGSGEMLAPSPGVVGAVLALPPLRRRDQSKHGRLMVKNGAQMSALGAPQHQVHDRVGDGRCGRGRMGGGWVGELVGWLDWGWGRGSAKFTQPHPCLRMNLPLGSPSDVLPAFL